MPNTRTMNALLNSALPKGAGVINEKMKARRQLIKVLADCTPGEIAFVTAGDPDGDRLALHNQIYNHSNKIQKLLDERVQVSVYLLEMQQEISSLRAKYGREAAVKRYVDSLVKQNAEYAARIIELQHALELTQEPEPKVRVRGEEYPWTRENYAAALHMLLEERLAPRIIQLKLGLSDQQFWSKLKNSRPDETLLGYPIPILAAGPMSYMEMWKIGVRLYGQSWKKAIVDLFGLRRTEIGFTNPLSDEQCKTLRQKWHDAGPPPKRKARKNVARRDTQKGSAVPVAIEPLTTELKEYLAGVWSGPIPPMPSAQPVYEGILRAGPNGITIRDLAESDYGKTTGMDFHQMGSRPSALERQGLIRASSVGGLVKVWVATYWDSHV